jgi:hypothetical protein
MHIGIHMSLQTRNQCNVQGARRKIFGIQKFPETVNTRHKGRRRFTLSGLELTQNE